MRHTGRSKSSSGVRSSFSTLASTSGGKSEQTVVQVLFPLSRRSLHDLSRRSCLPDASSQGTFLSPFALLREGGPSRGKEGPSRSRRYSRATLLILNTLSRLIETVRRSRPACIPPGNAVPRPCGGFRKVPARGPQALVGASSKVCTLSPFDGRGISSVEIRPVRRSPSRDGCNWSMTRWRMFREANT